MYRYVLFDFDGTVFDTLEGITKSVRYALNKVGIDAPLAELKCFAGPPLFDMFTEKFAFDPAEAQQAVKDFRERYIPTGVYESIVFPGIRELLCELRAAGLVTGIATSKPQQLAEELLGRENMLVLFDAISGSTLDGSDDSKQQVTRRAMELLGAVPEETVLVGDTKYDVAGAHKCGIKCIGVSYGYAADGELEAARADYIAADMNEIKDIVLK